MASTLTLTPAAPASAAGGLQLDPFQAYAANQNRSAPEAGLDPFQAYAANLQQQQIKPEQPAEQAPDPFRQYLTQRRAAPDAGLSPEFLSFVKDQEGFTPKASWDYKQHSVGYGTRAHSPDEQITEEDASSRLQDELSRHAGNVDSAAQAAGIDLTDRQREALASFDYNTGSASDVIQKHAAGGWPAISGAMEKYVNAGGQPLPGLQKRRAKELAWAGGQDSSDPADQADPTDPSNQPDQSNPSLASPSPTTRPAKPPEYSDFVKNLDYLKEMPLEIVKAVDRGFYHQAGTMVRGLARLGTMAGEAVPQAIDPNSVRWVDDIGTMLQHQGEKYAADPRFRNDLSVGLAEMASSLITTLGAGKALSATGAMSEAGATAGAFGVGGGESGAEQADAMGRPDLANQQFMLHGALNAAAGAQFPQAPQLLQAAARPVSEIALAAGHGAGTVAAIQAASNVASQPVTGNANLMDGVPTAALSGGILSGAMSAVPHMMARQPEIQRENVSLPWEGIPVGQVGNVRIADLPTGKVIVPEGPHSYMFVESPSGTLDWGMVTPQMVAEARGPLTAAPIRVQAGFHVGASNGFGWVHAQHHAGDSTIQPTHYADFLSKALGDYNQIFLQPNGKYLFVRNNGRQSVAVAKLQLHPEGFYSLTTGYAEANARDFQKTKGATLIWERSAPAQSGPGETGTPMYPTSPQSPGSAQVALEAPDQVASQSSKPAGPSQPGSSIDPVARLAQVHEELQFGKPDPARTLELEAERDALQKQTGVIPDSKPAEVPGAVSPESALADALGVVQPPAQPGMSESLQKLWADNSRIGITPPGTSAVVGAMSNIRGVIAEMRSIPKWTAFKQSLLHWNGALQRNAMAVHQIVDRIDKLVPDKVRQEGITNWIQANGDMTVLAQRLAATNKSKLKRGYEAAMNLTPQELTVAKSVTQYYADALIKGQTHGLLKEGLDNYVNQVWDLPKNRTLSGQPKPGAQSSGQLQQNFKFGQRRFHESFFDGEQAGLTPLTKEISQLVGIHMSEMNKVIATRQFIHDLTTRNAADGRPLAEPTGFGRIVEKDEGDSPALMVMPRAKGEEISDYKAINNPALSKWKWVAATPEGTQVLLKGDLVLHPDIADHLRNALGRSAIKEWFNSPGSMSMGMVKGLVRNVDSAQKVLKQTMLSMSPFHYVQEATHAIGHQVNPFWSLPKLDPTDPMQIRALDHGLMLSGDRVQLEAFSEGLSGGPLTNKLPWVGPHILKPMQDFLFHEYIPRLKYKTYQHILERNAARYAPELSKGEVNIDQVENLSANQANAAYGHLNYVEMGRNPTFQHILGSILLAPDFLEARGQFTGQAIKGATGAKVGIEQLRAMALLAGTFYIAARVLNKSIDGDYHYDHPFSVVHDGREYKMRSVPEDLLRLYENYHTFIYSRLSPVLGRGTFELITGRNYRGERVEFSEQMKELMTQGVPISIQGLMPGNRANVTAWENLVGSTGLQISRYSPSIKVSKLAQEWLKSKGLPEDKGVYPTSKFSALKNALDDHDYDRSRAEWKLLRETVHDTDKLAKGFKQSVYHPFTGSLDSDRKFKASLDPHDRQLYNYAAQRRDQIWTRFGKMRAGKTGN